jgi:hypothetical protein
MSSPTHATAQPRILRLFISYASEDLKLAVAIASGLRSALGEYFAEINLDRWSLQAGEEFKKQLATKLAQSDILIIIYTGMDKHSHGFTGWEVGFFEGVMRSSPESKRIIPMYLEFPPDTVSGYQGVGLKIPRDVLQLSVEEFESRNDVHADDPMCILIQELQDTVDKYTEEAGLARNRNKPDPLESFRSMRLDIFRYLKTTVEAVLKPQKQITIKSTGAAFRNGDADLPLDAKLLPVGVGSPMSIFGLQDEEITWEKFLQSLDGKHRDSWRIAIATVVTSSLQGINVDNSQVILSHDESRSYRLILTTATRYFDDSQEFNVYFVEALQREEYGDKNTTLLLKGLELICRYRFLFLESDSKFSGDNILITRPDRLADMAAELLRELNLMRKDSLNSGLDQPTVWANFVDWSNIHQMASDYEPAEQNIRKLISDILKVRHKPDEQVRLRQELSSAVKKLSAATEPQNSLLIKTMSQQLQSLVESGKNRQGDKG